MSELKKLKSLLADPAANRGASVREYFFEHGQLPLVFQAEVEINLADWIFPRREMLREKLHSYGGLLFRNFGVGEIDHFEQAVTALSGEPLAYIEQSSPRHSVAGRVYTSTDYPPDQAIFLHNEQSYNLNWCGKISFYCQTASPEGGQTPLADTRKILARLEPDVLDLFHGKGYIYQRNLGTGLGLDWQVVFQTESRQEVEVYCRNNRIDFQWLEGGCLRTSQKRRAVHIHPVTGEKVWFNHITFFHITSMPEPVRDVFLAEFSEQELPNQTFLHDGSSIPDRVINALRQAYLDEKVLFDWQNGDVLILDNMLACHGREPFSGPRRVLVSMTELLSEH